MKRDVIFPMLIEGETLHTCSYIELELIGYIDL